MTLWGESSRRLPAWLIDCAFALALGLSVFYLWWPTLETRFYQDDYWILFLTQNPLLGVVPSPGDPDWRPLGAFAPFYLLRWLFGLNPFAFHLANVLVHLLSGLVVYRLASAMMGARDWAIVAAIFYSLHWAHTRSMQWAAGIDNFLSAAWYLLAFLTYIRFRETRRRGAYWCSLLFFAAALLTKEWSVTLVPIMLWYELTAQPPSSRPRPTEQWKTLAIPWAGYGVLLFAYLSVRTLLFALPKEGQYALTLSTALALNNLAEYVRASVSSVADPPLTTMQAAMVLATLVFTLVASWILHWRLVILGLGWFVVTLSPILLISRRSSYFLAIPLVGMAIALASLVREAVQLLPVAAITRRASLVLGGLLLGGMLGSGAPEVRAQQAAQWLVRPQRLAECTLSYIASHWPSLPPHSVLYFRGFAAEEPYFLAFGTAINVHYNDNTIRSSFSPADTGSEGPIPGARVDPPPLGAKVVPRDEVASCERLSSPSRP